MPTLGPPLVLLAEEAVFREIAAEADLPDGLLVNGEAAGSAEDEPARPRIVWRDPARALPPAEAGAAANRSGREQFLFSLLGRTLCHVLVVHDPRGAEGESIRGFLQWQQRFDAELLAAVGKRHSEIDHVLVLILTQDIAAAQIEEMRALAALPGRRSYLMSRRLEPGENGVLFSEHVWPLYLGPLLLHLLCPLEGCVRQPGLHAWRCFEIAPQISPRLVEESLQEAFATAYARLLTVGADAARPVQLVLPQVSDSDPGHVQLQRARPAGPWFHFPAPSEAQRADAPDHWHALFHAAGRQRRDEIAQRGLAFLDDTDPTDGINPNTISLRIQETWAAVHADVSALSRRTELDRLPRGLDALTEMWQRDSRLDEQRRTNLERATGSAAEYELAARGFVTWRPRLVLFFVAALFVVYLGWQVTRGVLLVWAGLGLSPQTPFLQEVWAPAAVAGTAAAGALLAVAFAWGLERSRGEHARARLVETLDGIDRQMVKRHGLCLELIHQALEAWQGLRLHALRANLECLLRRAEVLVKNGLQPDLASVAAASPRAEAPAAGASVSERSKQRQEARKILRVVLPTNDDGHDHELRAAARADLAKVIERAVHTFTERWSAFTAEHDPEWRGKLPARPLLAMLAAYRQHLQSAIRRTLATSRLQNCDTAAVHQSLRAQLRAHGLGESTFVRYASCELPEGADFSPRTFYLPRRLHDALRGQFTGDDLDCQLLAEALAHGRYGYVYEECPVELAAGNGVATVQPGRVQHGR